MWANGFTDRDMGILLLALAVILLAIELKFYTHMISGLTGAILLGFGIVLLVRGMISIEFAIAISAAAAVIVVFLGRLGMRANRGKHLTGLETLVGETGVCRTAINPEGTIFVNGEYWQARSDHAIEAGKKVKVQKVENMTIWVTEA